MKLFINPFEKYSETQLIIAGLFFALMGSFLGTKFNARFDGAFDLHFAENVSFTQSFLDIAIVIATLTLLLFTLGKYINRKTRFIDILATVLIAKTPYYLLVFLNSNNKIATITEKLVSDFQKGKNPNLEISDLSIIILFSILTLVFLAWTIILMYNGFRTAVNSKGIRHNIFFILALLVSEIVTIILISSIN